MNSSNFKRLGEKTVYALLTAILLFCCGTNRGFAGNEALEEYAINESKVKNNLESNITVEAKKGILPLLDKKSVQKSLAAQKDGTYLWAKVGFLNGAYLEEFTPTIINADNQAITEQFQKLKTNGQYMICVNQWRAWYNTIFQTISQKAGKNIPKGGCIWLDITVEKNRKVSAFVNSATPGSDEILLAYANKLAQAVRSLNAKRSLMLPTCCQSPVVQVKFLARESDQTFLLENNSPQLLDL